MKEFTISCNIHRSRDSFGFLPMGIVGVLFLLLSFSGYTQQPITLPTEDNPFAVKLIQSRYMEHHADYINGLDPRVANQENNHSNRGDELTFFLDTAYVSSNTNPAYRYIYAYTSTGYLQTTKVEKYDDGAWQNYLYENCTYDEDGNKLTKLTYVWYNWNWLKLNLESYTYDDYNNRLVTIVKIWENETWVNVDKSTYVYNIAQNVASHLMEVWTNNTWVNFSREIYVYDQTDNMLTVLGDLWLNNQWTNDQRYTYTYDLNGNMLTGMSESVVNGNWEYVAQETYTYNTSNNRITNLIELWEGSWVNYLNYAYTYDGLDFLESLTGQIWDNGGWMNLEREHYAYGTFGGLESTLFESWNQGNWEGTFLAQYDFDEFGNAVNGDYYTWNGTSWAQDQDGILRMDYDFSIETAVFFGYSVNITYESILVGVEDENSLAETQVLCYPNPANELLNIAIDNQGNNMDAHIYIMDMHGKKIQTVFNGQLHIGSHNYVLETTFFVPGIYFVTVETNQSTQTTKLLITN